MEAAALPSPAAVASRSILLPAPLLRLRSDEQLVALFRAGSDEAFSVIHDRYRPRLLAYCRQMLGGSHADAEDVLQDVLLRAHAALRASDSPMALRAWLYRIAHNRCVDGIRRPPPVPAEIAAGAQPALGRGVEHDPSVEAERSEDLRRLVRDLLALPDQQRSALLMRELQGLSYQELALSLGVSVGAVKSLLVRARGGILSASAAREAPCPEIRLELAAAHDRGVRPSGHARRHLRECSGCRAHRLELRRVTRQLSAMAPPAGLVGLLGGGGGTGGGLAAAGGASGGAAVCGAAGVTAGKVAALVCAAALVGGAAFNPQAPATPRARSAAPPMARVAPPRALHAPAAAARHAAPTRAATLAPAASAPSPRCLPATAPADPAAASAAPAAASTAPAAPAPALPAPSSSTTSTAGPSAGVTPPVSSAPAAGSAAVGAAASAAAAPAPPTASCSPESPGPVPAAAVGTVAAGATDLAAMTPAAAGAAGAAGPAVATAVPPPAVASASALEQTATAASSAGGPTPAAATPPPAATTLPPSDLVGPVAPPADH